MSYIVLYSYILQVVSILLAIVYRFHKFRSIEQKAGRESQPWAGDKTIKKYANFGPWCEDKNVKIGLYLIPGEIHKKRIYRLCTQVTTPNLKFDSFLVLGVSIGISIKECSEVSS